jgi:hypothetical protein
MHVNESARLLEQLADCLRPGGVVAFQDSDFTYPPRTFPELPLASAIHQLALARGIPGGPEMAMGTRLFEVFIGAGLGAPQMQVEAPMGGGPDWLGYEYLTETLRTLLPVLQRFNVPGAADVQIDTLASRLRAEAVEHRAVQLLPLLVGAWARKQA